MNDLVVESSFVYRGIKCLVIFMPMGHRCGYVDLPEHIDTQKLYGNFIGGNEITFADSICHGQEGNWIGFDHAHSFDGVDYESLHKYNMYDPFTMYSDIREGKKVTTQEECQEECKELINEVLARYDN